MSITQVDPDKRKALSDFTEMAGDAGDILNAAPDDQSKMADHLKLGRESDASDDNPGFGPSIRRWVSHSLFSGCGL
jgi:hypothetical protein